MLKKLMPAAVSLSVLLPSGNVYAHSFADAIEQAEKSVCLVEFQSKGPSKEIEGPKEYKQPENQEDPFKDFFNKNQDSSNSLGSCFVVSVNNKKYIVTNEHVVDSKEKNSRPYIFFHNDLKKYPAKVLGADEVSDLAVLEMSNSDGKEKLNKIDPLTLGNSDKVRKGDQVFAIGHPVGQKWTVTQGIVSATKKRSTNTWQEVIQSDVSINQGNSGGPLFNENGEVVGVNSFIISPQGGNIGINFSVTSNNVNYIINTLISDGKVERGRLGIAFVVDDDLGKIIIEEIQKDGPVDKTGKLKKNDILLKINGRDINFPADIGLAMDTVKPNQKVELEVLRGKKTIKLVVTTGLFVFD